MVEEVSGTGSVEPPTVVWCSVASDGSGSLQSKPVSPEWTRVAVRRAHALQGRVFCPSISTVFKSITYKAWACLVNPSLLPNTKNNTCNETKQPKINEKRKRTITKNGGLGLPPKKRLSLTSLARRLHSEQLGIDRIYQVYLFHSANV